MPTIVETIQQQREAIDSREHYSWEQMASAYRTVIDGLEDDLAEVESLIQEAYDEGLTPHPDWLRRQGRYQRLIAQAEAGYARFAETGEGIMGEALGISEAAGRVDATTLVGQATGNTFGFDGSINANALERFVGAYSDASPLRPILDAYGSHAGTVIEQTILAGMGSGNGPAAIIGDIRSALTGDVPTSRLRALVRTEMMRAYRGSLVDQYQDFGGVVVGLVWSAQKGPRTCLACLAMDGKVFPLDEPPTQFHVCCRCTIAPEPDELYPSVRAELARRGNGKAWFDRQPDDVKRRMLPSREAFDAYQRGDLTLDDFVGTHHSAEWGDTHYQLSGRLALANADKRPKPPAHVTGKRQVPNVTVKPPASRHYIMQVSPASPSRSGNRNTVIEPWVDVQADIDAINRGEGIVDHGRANAWVNGRLYGYYADRGTAWPISGDGFITMDQKQYSAFRQIVENDGLGPESEVFLERSRQLTDDDRELVRRIWRIREQEGGVE
ncbi:MAG: minor capsid protein [Thermomicrobiales bacterium]